MRKTLIGTILSIFILVFIAPTCQAFENTMQPNYTNDYKNVIKDAELGNIK